MQQPVVELSVSPSAAPLEHSRPKLAGWSGSPAIAARPPRRRHHAAADAAIGTGRRRLPPSRRSLSAIDRQDRHGKQIRPPSSAHRQRSGRAFVGRHGLAALELDDPAVQRAGHRAALHDALRRAARRDAGNDRPARNIDRRRCGTWRSAARSRRGCTRRAPRGCRRASPTSIQSLRIPRTSVSRRPSSAEFRALRRRAARSAHGSVCTKRCEWRKRSCERAALLGVVDETLACT